MCVCVYVFTNAPALAIFDTRSILKRDITSLNVQFILSLTDYHGKVEEHSLSGCLLIAGERIDGFMPF